MQSCILIYGEGLGIHEFNKCGDIFNSLINLGLYVMLCSNLRYCVYQGGVFILQGIIGNYLVFNVCEAVSKATRFDWDKLLWFIKQTHI